MIKANTRADIVKLMRENAGTVSSNLHDLFQRTVEDLLTAGLDPEQVVLAILDVGIEAGNERLGPSWTAKLLRRCADESEAIFGRQQ